MNSFRRPVVFVLALLSCVGVVHSTHQQLDKNAYRAPAGELAIMPSLRALELLSLGYNNLVADYYWLQALNSFGALELHERGYPNLDGYLRRVVSLDPNFASAYFLAGTALTVDRDIEIAMEFLEQGMRARPDIWRLPFLFGFNAYYYRRDFSAAARAFATAAALEGSPRVAGRLATRLAAHAGEPAVGIEMIDSLLQITTDDNLRKTYMQRRKLLVLEQGLSSLQAAIDRYKDLHGRSPQRLQELITPGVLRQVPAMDPLGGEYFIDPSGLAATTSEKQRLRLSPAALEKTRARD